MAFSTADCSFDLPFSDRTTNFTCDQLSTYWAAYASWTKTEQLIDTVINISLFLAGCSAFVSYVLMVIVFRSPYFNGASYIYHKATIVMEIVHMAVMAQVRSRFSYQSSHIWIRYVFRFRLASNGCCSSIEPPILTYSIEKFFTNFGLSEMV